MAWTNAHDVIIPERENVHAAVSAVIDSLRVLNYALDGLEGRIRRAEEESMRLREKLDSHLLSRMDCTDNGLPDVEQQREGGAEAATC
jgi:hypothetical protein